jgi:hypothetical protein
MHGGLPAVAAEVMVIGYSRWYLELGGAGDGLRKGGPVTVYGAHAFREFCAERAAQPNGRQPAG